MTNASKKKMSHKEILKSVMAITSINIIYSKPVYFQVYKFSLAMLFSSFIQDHISIVELACDFTIKLLISTKDDISQYQKFSF